MSAILALACCAILCGARSIAAIAQFAQDHDLALRHRLGFTRRPPKRHGIRKVLLALEVTAFERALTSWAERVLGRPLRTNAGEGVPPAISATGPLQAAALDGKMLRDVTMGEDASRVRKGSGLQVLAALRNAAIGLQRLGGATASIAATLRRNAARVTELVTIHAPQGSTFPVFS